MLKRTMIILGVCIAVAAVAAPLLGVSRPGAPAEFTLELGPVDLEPRAGHHDTPQPLPLLTTMPSAGWVRGFEIVLEAENGEIVPQDVLHHVKLLAPDRRELFSPDMRHLLAGGSETTPVLIPALLGRRVARGDSLLLTAMMHNPTSRAWKGVRVRMRVWYTPARGWMPPLEVEPFFQHVTQPGTPAHYDLPPGSSSRSWDAKPAIAGRILAVGGHIHRYGTSLRMIDVTAGKTLWDAEIELDSTGNVARVPRTYFLRRGGLRIEPGHVYRFIAEYHNPTTDTLREAGMGTVAGILVPDDDAEWPMVDRNHPVYRWRSLEERGPHHTAHTHGKPHGHHGAAHKH